MSAPPKVTLKFAVIDEHLEPCAKTGTDASYGKCVLRRTKDERFTPSAQNITGGNFVSKGDALVLEDVFGGTIEGNGMRTGPRVCVPSVASKPIGCRVELDFPTPDELDEHGLPPGTPAVLRKCVVKGKEGALVPVSSVEEAVDASRSFCSCVKDGDETVRRKCARHR